MVQTVGREPDPAKRLRKKQGARLRDVRKNFRGLTLEQVADRMRGHGVDVTPQSISMWETGVTTPRPHMQVAVCRVLDVMPSSIFGLDTEVA
jgi:transcriptional regulator with XRE-family HTH domain